ncbi:NUDIX domain-containing protein [Saprospiraceae bacterium]|nr:NUDIX domain-containing protein [Saprospiraceae bacterium]
MDSENSNNNNSSLANVHKLAVSVDNVILGYDNESLKVLLIDCKTPPYVGKDSLLGEMVGPDETLDEAAHRILEYWTGNESLYLEEVKSYSAIDRHPLGRVITVAYYSLVEIKKFRFDETHKKRLKWVDVNQVKDLAFDHDMIFNECLAQLRQRLRIRPIGFNLLPKKFSLNQLQNLYEVVLGLELDKRNFRRKINSLNLLLDLDETQQDVAHRPAKLFSFDDNKYKEERSNGLKFEL